MKDNITVSWGKNNTVFSQLLTLEARTRTSVSSEFSFLFLSYFLHTTSSPVQKCNYENLQNWN